MKTFTKSQKAKRLKIAQQHQEADRFVQGQRLQDGSEGPLHRGSFFGCLMQKKLTVLEIAAKKMNLPLTIIHIAERIFERLPEKEAVLFPVQLLEAMPTDTDITEAYRRYMYRLLMDDTRGAIAYAGGREDVIAAIKKCADLYVGDMPTADAARFTAEAAYSADATYSAYSAAASKRHRQRQRDVLIEELSR